MVWGKGSIKKSSFWFFVLTFIFNHSIFAFDIQSTPISGCPGGLAVIWTYPFLGSQDSQTYEFGVFSSQGQTIGKMSEDLKQKWNAVGADVDFISNAGFFVTADPTKTYSFFRSSLNQNYSKYGTAMGPRACMVYDRTSHKFEIKMSSPQQENTWRLDANVEVYCAGPQLVRDGQNVAKNQYCLEKFDPACRPDHSDPGLEFDQSLPRTGSCVTASGDFKVFAYISTRTRCGISIKDLAEVMVKSGCLNGLNHDGGGSAQIYFSGGQRSSPVYLPSDRDTERRVPVWFGIIKKKTGPSMGQFDLIN